MSSRRSQISNQIQITAITTSASAMPSNSANGTYFITTGIYNSSCSCTQTSVMSVSGSRTLYNGATVTSTPGAGSTGSSAGASGSTVAGSSGASSTSSGAGTSSSDSGAGSVAPQQGGAFIAAAIALAGLVYAL
ncbi:MAG: hypothetical protein Q9227_006585 [Pyrenula ochraceoflavens]